MIIFILLFVAILLALFVRQRKKCHQLRSELNIPGPDTDFLYGNFHQLMERVKKDKQPFKLMEEWIAKYGSVFGVYVGPQLNVIVTDLDMAKDILIKNFNNFINRHHEPLEQQRPLVDSLFQLKGHDWKNVRSFITPNFGTARLRQMSLIIKDKINTLKNKLANKSGTTFDIYDDYQALGLDVITKCAFGMETNGQDSFEDPFFKNCRKWHATRTVRRGLYLSFSGFLFPGFDFIWSRLRFLVGFGEAENWMLGKIEQVLDNRAKNYKSFQSSTDILQSILEQNQRKESKDQNKLTKELITSNCFVLLLGGFETTSTSLAYTSWLLAKHPDKQKKLQAEIDDFLKQKSESDITMDDIMKLNYLDAVFHESLRMLPPVIGFVMRKCVHECTINGYKFVPGMEVKFPVWAIHHSETNWPDPDKYQPERFLDGSVHHPMSWMPFGAGPRNCIGKRFAEVQYKMVLFYVMSKFQVEFGLGTEDPLVIEQSGSLLRPVNGVQLKVTVRN